MTQGRYLDLPLEDVIGDRFGRYSKYIIQDRALPDVRDGLKPVQRRILYAMHEEGNTSEKNFRKAAKTVGTVIGNFHPHGDSSVYDAMVRMSQDWKMNIPLIEMHGNNGSIDGDPAAAMRYTEARLAKISSELLRDIEKDTVDHIYNFDDTDVEPTVLPAMFPNLLVNGSTGISAGYATDIPPHNLNEVIDACIYQMENPTATIAELMKYIKGPDFPTGGIIQGKKGIKDAFTKGKGRIVLRGKTSIEKMSGQREKIIIDEIPYDVNKANLVKRIDELRIERTVEGIAEVRDESDRNGLRIVIELRKNADSEGILNYLFKNTDLQITYHYNMVAIQNKTPKLLNLTQILSAYIEHQKEVVTRQTTFDLKKRKERAHIVEGLIRAISLLDEIISIIRNSKNKANAKENLQNEYDFSEEQSEAIVNLQLYRLTNTDIVSLEEEREKLLEEIGQLEKVLSSEKQLIKQIKGNFMQLKKDYGQSRLSTIEKEISDLTIDVSVTIPSEDVIVTVTSEGYIKRTSLRSYSASAGEDLPLKDGDYLIGQIETNTTDELLIFTNKGNYIKIPTYELPDIRWKDQAQHISNICSVATDERFVGVIPLPGKRTNDYVVFITRQGMIKKSKLDLYDATRFNRTFIAINLKEDDEVLSVTVTNGQHHVFLVSNIGNALRYDEATINEVGIRAQGVRAMQLKKDEYIVNGATFNPSDTVPDIYILTQRGFHKKIRMSDFSLQDRTNRGLSLLRLLKTNPHIVQYMFLVLNNDIISLITDNNDFIEVRMDEMGYSERVSNGSAIKDLDNQITQAYKQSRL